MNAPQYIEPDRPRNTGGTDWAALLAGFSFFLLANHLITEWLAMTFGFQRALGAPVLRFGIPIYWPWKWALWSVRFLMSDDPHVRNPLYWACGAVLVSMIVAMNIIRIVVARHTKPNDKLDHIHGSASFMSDKDIRNSAFVKAQTGAVIGGWEESPDNVRYLRDDSDGHIIAFAQTGLGKTGGLVIPSALSNPEKSMLILDPKGEVHRLTSGYRESAGNRIFRFCPADIRSSKFNVFAEMRLTTIHAVKDAQTMADMFCHVPGQESKEPHWDDIAASLVTGVLLHEGYKALNENRGVTGRDLSRALNPPDRQFVDVLKEMLTYQHDPQGRFNWVFKDSSGKIIKTKTHPVVMQCATQMLDRTTSKGPTDEFTSCLSCAQKRFDIYRDPLVINATSESDFTIDELVNHQYPVTLYVVVPLGDQARLLHLMRTIFTVIFYRLTEIERATTPNLHEFLWLLDEFTSLRKMEIFGQLMPLARGFGIKVYLICQSLKQILDAYGAYQSIIDGAGNTMLSYAPGPDKETAQMLSDLSGIRTVLHESASFSGDRYGPSKKQITTHIQHGQRPLLTPDEVRRLRPPIKEGRKVVAPGDMLIFPSGSRPIYGRQTLYWFDPIFSRRAAIPEVQLWPAI